MLAEQAEELEEALWSALNNLNESAQMAHRLGKEARQRGHFHVARRFEEREQNARRQAASIQNLLSNGQLVVPAVAEDEVPNGKPRPKRAVPPTATGEQVG